MQSVRLKAASVEETLRLQLASARAEVQKYRNTMGQPAIIVKAKEYPEGAHVLDRSKEPTSYGEVGVDTGREILPEATRTEQKPLARGKRDNVNAMAGIGLRSMQRAEVTDHVVHGSLEGVTQDGFGDYDVNSGVGKTPEAEHRWKSHTTVERERFKRHLSVLESQVTSSVNRINTLLLYVKGSSSEANSALLPGSNVDLQAGNEKGGSSMNDLAITCDQHSDLQRDNSQSSLARLSSSHPLEKDHPSFLAHNRASTEPPTDMVTRRIINIPLFIFIVQTTVLWNPNRATLNPVKRVSLQRTSQITYSLSV